MKPCFLLLSIVCFIPFLGSSQEVEILSGKKYPDPSIVPGYIDTTEADYYFVKATKYTKSTYTKFYFKLDKSSLNILEVAGTPIKKKTDTESIFYYSPIKRKGKLYMPSHQFNKDENSVHYNIDEIDFDGNILRNVYSYKYRATNLYKMAPDVGTMGQVKSVHYVIDRHYRYQDNDNILLLEHDFSEKRKTTLRFVKINSDFKDSEPVEVLIEHEKFPRIKILSFFEDSSGHFFLLHYKEKYPGSYKRYLSKISPAGKIIYDEELKHENSNEKLNYTSDKSSQTSGSFFGGVIQKGGKLIGNYRVPLEANELKISTHYLNEEELLANYPGEQIKSSQISKIDYSRIHPFEEGFITVHTMTNEEGINDFYQIVTYWQGNSVKWQRIIPIFHGYGENGNVESFDFEGRFYTVFNQNKSYIDQHSLNPDLYKFKDVSGTSVLYEIDKDGKSRVIDFSKLTGIEGDTPYMSAFLIIPGSNPDELSLLFNLRDGENFWFSKVTFIR